MHSLRQAWASRSFRLWASALLLSAAVISLGDTVPWLHRFPDAWVIPLTDWLNVVFSQLREVNLLFRLIAEGTKTTMALLQSFLHWLPWPFVVAFLVLTAYRAAGVWLASFAAATCTYTLVTGLWTQTVNTLALVCIAIPFALLFGFLLGVWAEKSNRARKSIEPLLDLMQTVPAFAYLVPAMVLFGFGPQVGLVVSIVFATPPMARNVFLGLRRVPAEIKEAADMSGGTPWQRFWYAEVPSALPQMIVGINQAVLAAFSMVIIASVIGGFNDIGWEVSGSYRRQALGDAVEAGIVITLFAILLDRTGAGYAHRALIDTGSQAMAIGLFPILIGAGTIVVLLYLAQSVGPLVTYPESWTFSIAQPIEDGMAAFLRDSAATLKKIKFLATVFFMKPIEIGLIGSVHERFWGFALTPGVISTYVVGIGVLTALAWRQFGWPGGIMTIILGTLLYLGCTGIPWPVWFLIVGLLTWDVAGRRVFIFVLAGMSFILLTGLWMKAMLSLYLVIAAFIVCFFVGCGLGIAASEFRWLSRIVRPMNDTLQSIPLYVLLIPPLWFFRTSEFASMLAIVAYAIVPCIRYTEFGLRHVSNQVLEAAQSMGMTRRQMLWNVKLPMAMPEIMLGLNQTVLLGLSMLVIAALITSRGLGQEIYNALGQRDPGLGVAAGLSMAIVAMTVDRILQALSRARREALGVE